MRKLMLLPMALVVGCASAPLPTIAQYCGQTLGLKYGSQAYANCGVQYSSLKIQAASVQQQSRNSALDRLQRTLDQDSANQAVVTAAQTQQANVYVHPN